eukprot:2331783-Rhodomonas_salina.2
MVRAGAYGSVGDEERAGVISMSRAANGGWVLREFWEGSPPTEGEDEEVGCTAIVLRACYAVSGTEIA